MDKGSYFMTLSSDIFSRSLTGMCCRGHGGACMSPFLIFGAKISIQVIQQYQNLGASIY
jgi:hypothetical protein